LLDLRTLFPDAHVELYGLNRRKEGRMFGQPDFARNARRFRIPVPAKRLLPKPSFYDAGEGLRYPGRFFDVIVSQVAFPYVGDKAKLLEEMWRVLKPAGKAFLHVDSFEDNYPDFMRLNPETPRFVIYRHGKLVKLGRHLRMLRKKGHDIRLQVPKGRPGRFVLMTKSAPKPLKLGLRFDDAVSFDLTRFSREKKIEGLWWGTRSVFRAA
jgi:SAM-dependent methyltransferase